MEKPLELADLDEKPLELEDLSGDIPKLDESKISEKMLEQYRAKTIEIMSQSQTKRDFLGAAVDNLAECKSIATEIYKAMPTPDNAYQLAALANAYTNSLSVHEKMKDPIKIINDIEGQIKSMFTITIKALVLEIDKTKKELQKRYPNDRITIDDEFSRMIKSIAPETQGIYVDLHKNLKSILGIK